ncbi:MAG: hypothetical protein ACR2NA_12790 [Solirubrobacterales bacterium]
MTEAAARLLERLCERSPEIRGATVLGAADVPLAASGGLDHWALAASAFLSAADEAAPDQADRVHVATQDGDVFAVRHGALAAVATAERFALASLLSHDLRQMLRDLDAEIIRITGATVRDP